MITTTIKTAIKCGSKGTLDRIYRLPESDGGELIKAKEFRCRRCHQRWNSTESSTADDLDRASCSNCYSSNVEITRIEINYLEAKDFRD